MATILIVYPMESTQVETVASILAETLMNYTHTVLIQNGFDTTVVDFEEADCVLIGSPSIDSEPVPEIAELLNDLENSTFDGKRAAAFGVSDEEAEGSVAPAVDHIQDFLVSHDATLIHAGLKIEGDVFDRYTTVVEWAKEISQHVDYPLETDEEDSMY